MSISEQELDDVALRWALAMRRGDFAEAWRQTDRIEHRRRIDEAQGSFEFRPGHHLLWNGDAFHGRDVLVRCNHGLGDTVQFIRYVPELRAIARSVTVLVQPQLLQLFAGMPELGAVRNGWTDAPPPAHDVEIEIMELPYAFRSTLASLPRRVPYVRAEALAESAQGLPEFGDGVLNVGLVWTSSEWDLTRSISIAALAPLAALHGVRFHALQQGARAGEWRDAPFPMTPLAQHTGAVEVLAAAMRKLDLVITVDCMVAHLAGALARPVWVLLRHEADWRWMDAREDSPWYPTMRLFRQPRPGDWCSVAEALAQALQTGIVGERQRAGAL